MSKIFLIILLFLPYFQLTGNEPSDTTSSSFEEFLKRLIEGRKKVKNHPLLSLDYSYSTPSFPHNYFSENLASAYGMNIRYGFMRYIDDLPIENIFEFSSEYVIFGTFSSHFKPTWIPKIGITTDAWRFGAGLFDGSGFKFDKSRLLLYHSSAFNWWHIDFETQAKNSFDQNIIDIYDETFRFGTYFSGGINFQIFPVIFIDIGYEHSLVYQKFIFAKWLLSWTIENLSQRWLDFFEDDFIAYFGKTYPLIRFLIKNSASLILYELRRWNMNWPSNSYPSLSYDCIIIGVKLVF